MYLTIVVFMIILAVFDLFVGVSNDAVNFLSSAIGAKVAKWRTIMIIAALGIIIGALMSNGMMDIARHGILDPDYFTFNEVMTVFLAVMITDVIVLDLFNTLKLPTSTTVSLVFELLGAAFIISALKMSQNASLDLAELLNFDKAFSVILAIFVSVAIAFFCAVIVQWVARMIFSFNYRGKATATIIFGALAFTMMIYFIILKGLGGKELLNEESTAGIAGLVFIITAGLTSVLYKLKVNIFKIIVLLGTFALAMAFAGNDLVNFIGVPLAGVSSYTDFAANGNGNAESFLMHSLSESAKTPKLYLMIAGVVMILAMCLSRKAKDVVKTSVNLSSQDESENMFGSSMPARAIVKSSQRMSERIADIMPKKVKNFVNSRFNKNEMIYEEDGAAFDMVRASVNLVLAAFLIILGTMLTLPLSTTYVTFMVAMGSSLADRAWGRESAVFRVTGVLSVIGGWFITAGLTFCACALVCFLMYKGGIIVMAIFMAICVFTLIKSNIKKRDTSKDTDADTIYSAMMKCHDPEIIRDLLNKHVAKTQSDVAEFTIKQMNNILSALYNDDATNLKKSIRAIDNEKQKLKKEQKKEILCLRRLPVEMTIERNTWFYLGMNSAEQYIYCLKRMIEPIKEHIDNNFTPMPKGFTDECEPVVKDIEEMMKKSADMIKENDFILYDDTRNEAEKCKENLSALRDIHIKRMQYDKEKENLRISLVYLNVLQEIQMVISTMRHQIRAYKKFSEA